MIRIQFVAFGGFALAVVCSAAVGIASSGGESVPDPLSCDSRSAVDASKLRVEVAGPDGGPLRDERGKPFTIPACPTPPGPPSPNGAARDGNCRVEKDWRGALVEACEDVQDCGFDVNARGELVELCEGRSVEP